MAYNSGLFGVTYHLMGQWCERRRRLSSFAGLLAIDRPFSVAYGGFLGGFMATFGNLIPYGGIEVPDVAI